MLNRDDIAHEYALTIMQSPRFNNNFGNMIGTAFDLADAMIAEAQKRKSTERPSVVGDGWISVEDRKPKEGQPVAVYFGMINEDVRMVSYMTWTDQEYAFKGNIEYIVWQPLPQAPK